MTKDDIINLLTLQDTQSFRLKAMRDTGIYKKEPKGFRSRLYEIYNKLSFYDLETLLKLKDI
jgi:hypothetical protein